MNMQEEFEKWHLEHFGEEPRYSDYSCPVYTYDGQMIRTTWNACAELMQAEIDRLTLEIDVQSKWGPKWVEKHKQCEKQAEELASLRGFAIWLTGCGHDFTQHKYFLDNRHLLIGDIGESE